MIYFTNKKKQEMVRNMLNVRNREEEFKRFTTLQNEISIAYNTKVLAVTSINDDDLAAAFAQGLAYAYANNNSSALIIDANLYGPRLKELLGITSETPKEPKIDFLDERTGVAFLNKEIYPSTVYKNGVIHGLIKEGLEKYEHIIVIVPSVGAHKEVALLSNVLDSTLLVTMRDVTKKKDIFEALKFFANEKLPISKVVILK